MVLKIAGLHAGFAKAKGDVIITMDADLQDSPEILVYDMIVNSKYDLVLEKRNVTILLLLKICLQII
jgi:glycosyltransferase involved in cell wall biosynthesis